MFDFGILQPYIDDDLITDVDSNSKTVYVTHQYKGTYKVENLEENYLTDLINRLCNTPEINDQFNYEKPILDGIIDGLRIHAEHNSFVTSGDAINVRKTPLELVITENLIKKGYCTKDVFELMKIIVKAELSVIFGGEVGTGKSQLMKTFVTYIKGAVLFIADIDELRLTELYPERNYRQMKVNQFVDYTRATSSALRDNPSYICFQEVRDSAVDDLFLALSGSSKVTATLHIKNALLMPQRMIQLSNNKNDNHLLSTIHDYVQVCIVPKKIIEEGITKRFIGEIAVFWNNDNGEPQKKLIYEKIGDEAHMYELPIYFKEEFLKKKNLTLDWSEKIEKI